MSSSFEKAIITGATGMLGMSVAKYLSSLGVQLLCLGREYRGPEQVTQDFGRGSRYLRLPMQNIKLLPEESRSFGWEAGGDTVFYNFAWGGQKGLTDGKFSDQLDNVVWAAEAVKAAKKMGCTKFVNSGSMEETFIEEFLRGNRMQAYSSTQTYYGLAKLAARDMCRMTSYLEGIDYVHTRMSVPLAPDLSKRTYISSTIRKILKGEPCEPPISESLYDLVLLDDVNQAYHLIGLNGRNKADYFIGTGRPATLRQHFDRLSSLSAGKKNTEIEQVTNQCHLFDVRQLEQDTGFVASLGIDGVVSTLPQS
jgi:nucleoside-diphosphate-sugar epimerase